MMTRGIESVQHNLPFITGQSPPFACYSPRYKAIRAAMSKGLDEKFVSDLLRTIERV
jgi:hypothetical protein